MGQKRLHYCCGATWLYTHYYMGDVAACKKSLEDSIASRRNEEWPNGQIYILVASQSQVNHPNFVEALKQVGFACVSAAMGPHHNPNYLFVKADSPIAIPDNFKLPEVKNDGA